MPLQSSPSFTQTPFMEENPKKAKNFDVADEKYHLKEVKDDGFAAMILASLKHSQLDNETSFILEILKCEVLGQTKVNPCWESQQDLQKSKHNGMRDLLKTAAFEKVKSGAFLLTYPGFGKTIDGKILPRIPPVECLNGLIGICSKPFEKQLTASDVNDHLHRLALNYEDVDYALVPLLHPEEDLESGIPVTTYDCEGKEYRMHFKIWHPHNCVLIGDWKRFYHEHVLRAHEDWVTVWMFRHRQTHKPCFVITSRRLPICTPIKRCRKGSLQHQGKKKKMGRYWGYHEAERKQDGSNN